MRKNSLCACAGILLTLGTALMAADIDEGRLRTREFVVMGYQGIVFELGSGEGPYLHTLLELLRINPDDRARILDQIRASSHEHANIMDFADDVARLQSNDRAASSSPAQIPIPSGPSIYSGDRLENALSHLTRGMKIVVFTKGGGRFAGQFEEYGMRRLWLKGADRKSFLLGDILAVDAPQL